MTPDRNLRFPESKSFNWNDWTPKLGYAYDLFGNGKTALKISLNKYLRGVGTSFSQVPDPNPVSAAVGAGNATRTWDDFTYPVGDPRRGNYVPDCDLTTRTPGANGECGAVSDPLFGANNSAAVLNQLTWDEESRTGWNKRGFNWEFATGVQHEILPRVSLDVGYFRRWYGNFQVVDNLALAPDRLQHLQPDGAEGPAAARRRRLRGQRLCRTQADTARRRVRRHQPEQDHAGQEATASRPTTSTVSTSTSTAGWPTASCSRAAPAPAVRATTTAR
jgi:hypothetical protein